MVKFEREEMSQDKLSSGVQWVEGYWWEPAGTKWPKPVKHGSPWPLQAVWLERLAHVEGVIAPHAATGNPWVDLGKDRVRFFAYGGGTASLCRLCSVANGNREYQVCGNAGTDARTYRWPEGFRHYVERHNVIPSRMFHDLINGLDARWE